MWKHTVSLLMKILTKLLQYRADNLRGPKSVAVCTDPTARGVEVSFDRVNK